MSNRQKTFKTVKGKPRYLQFQIPQEWDFVKFGSLYKFVKGKVPKTIFDKKDVDRVPYLTSVNLQGKSQIYVTKSDGILIHEHDVFILSDGEGSGRVYTSRSGILASTFNLFKKKKNQIDNKFIFHYLDHYYPLFRNTRYGTGIPHVDKYVVQNLIIPIPSKNEEKKIISTLSKLDELILHNDKILQQTKLFKKGIMKKLLTEGIGHTKFKKVKFLFGKDIEIPAEWSRKPISEICTIKSGSTPRRSHKEYFLGNIPWVTSTDLNNGIIVSTLESITNLAVEKTSLAFFPKGTFLIASYGLEAEKTRGKCGILGFDATINQACMAIIPSNEVLTKFLFYFYLQFGENIVFNFAQGTKQQNLYSNTVNLVPLLIPSKNEQQKIISILSKIDLQISSHQNFKLKLHELRKGTRQQLLTGNMRLKT